MVITMVDKKVKGYGKHTFSGFGTVEVDDSMADLIITLPCYPMEPEEVKEVHKKQAVITVEMKDEN